MISENLSHDTKVWTIEYDLDGNILDNGYGKQRITGEQDKDGNFIYDNLPDYDYVNITYDTYEYIKDPNSKSKAAAAVKTKVDTKYVDGHKKNGEKGIMPSILEELLSARKSTRN